MYEFYQYKLIEDIEKSKHFAVICFVKYGLPEEQEPAQYARAFCSV
jgi:hypothetical protein